MPAPTTYSETAPINGDPIVHREEEWQLILREIQKRRDHPVVPKSAIVLQGAVGLGKSTFLRDTVLERLEQDYPGLPRTLIDFDNDTYTGRKGRGRLIIDLVRRLADSISEPMTEAFTEAAAMWEKAAQLPNSGRSTPLRERALFEAEEELVGLFNLEFIPALTSRRERRPVVILLDTVERLGRKDLEWLQSSLQEPTVRLGFVIWVMASRFTVKRLPFFLQKAYYTHPLQPFSEEQIKRQEPKHEAVAGVLREYGLGVPAATKVLAEQVEKIEEAEKRLLQPDELRTAHEDELVASLESLLALDDYLGSVDQTLRASVKILSPLRMFNAAAVAELLPGALENYLGNSVAVDSWDIIQQLQGAQIVAWDMAKSGYVIEEPLRQIIVRVFRGRHAQLFEQVHRQAYAIYKTWSENDAERRRDYLVERFFHAAFIAVQLEKSPDVVIELRGLLFEARQRFYTHGEQIDWIALNELKERILGDTDITTLLSQADLDEILVDLSRENQSPHV